MKNCKYAWNKWETENLNKKMEDVKKNKMKILEFKKIINPSYLRG
jgi:hypothetical protein